MAKVSDNEFPKVILVEQASPPDTPASGTQKLFLDSADGHLKRVDESDTVVDLEESVGSGYDEGTSFPVSPSADDKFYRTDRNLLYFYDGTRWLTTQVFLIQFKHEDSGFTWPLSASSVTVHRAVLPFGDDYDVYLLDWHFMSSVNTTNNGSAFWTATVKKFNSAGGGDTTIATMSTGAGPDAAGSFYNKKVAINALMGAFKGLYTDATKTGAPGTFRFNGGHLTCRLVG
jgi:hypothetical protein